MRYHKEKFRIFTMFQSYQTEIIALSAIIVVVLIYMIIKKKQSTKIKKNLHDNEEKTPEVMQSLKVYDEYDLDEVQDEYEPEFEGSEEGSFGEPEPETAVKPEKITPVQEEVTQTKTEKKPSAESNFTPTIKREVPVHGKITKENFKEFKGLRVLVAEDNIINQKVIKGLLNGTGIEIVIADDGQDALDILEKDSNFLIILMDAHMPRVDGFEATRIIKANRDYDHITIIALSGDTASDDIRKMKEAGMSEHLEKPLRISALYDMFYLYSKNQPAPLKKVKQEEKTTPLIELNTIKGLKVCGDDKEFYLEILNEFIDTYDNSTQNLGNYLKSEKLQEADKLLLDIIGLSANIGAETLHDISSQIKSILHDNPEKSYLSLVDDYKMHLDNLIIEIKKYRS